MKRLKPVEQLKSRKFLLQMGESTLRDGEVVLQTYARSIDKGEFAEEMKGTKKGCLKLMKDGNPEKLPQQ